MMNGNGKFLIVFVALAQAGFAAEPFCNTGKPHPIDVQLEQDVKKSGGVTVAMREAQGKAWQKWDDELNKTYKELSNSLSEEDRELLKQSQRAWLKFRDAEIELLWSKSLHGSGGTLSPVIVADVARAAVSERVCEFIRYRELVNNL